MLARPPLFVGLLPSAAVFYAGGRRSSEVSEPVGASLVDDGAARLSAFDPAAALDEASGEALGRIESLDPRGTVRVQVRGSVERAPDCVPPTARLP